MGIYELSIKRPFLDIKKLLIGLLFNIIPIVNFISIGYALRCAKLSMKNNFDMPEWKDKGELFKNGFFYAVISLIYLIPVIILFFVVFFSFLVKLVTLKTMDFSVILKEFLSAGSLSLILFTFLLLFFILYITPSAIMNFVNKNKFSSAFEFSNVFRKAFTGQYFVTTLLMFLYTLLLYLILGFIPFIGGIVASFLIYITTYSAYGAIYNKL